MANQRAAWRLLFTLVGAFAMLGLLLAAACGDDDDDSGDDGGDEPTASASPDGGDDGDDDDGGGEPTDGDDDDDGGDGDDDGDGSGDPFADLDDLIQGLDSPSGMVAYEITDAGVTTGFATWADGSSNTRYDSTDEDGNTSTTIVTSDTLYLCEESESVCQSYPVGTIPGAGQGLYTTYFGTTVLGAIISAAQLAGVGINTSSDSYAGRDAECYEWDEAGLFAKLCFDKETGVMLHQEIGGDGEEPREVTATEFSEDVSASDFEPPYPVEEG